MYVMFCIRLRLVVYTVVLFLMIRRPPRSTRTDTLFPYPTLFRSPIIFPAIGPKSLEFAGEHCDGVLLHPFVSAQGVANSAKIVRDAAERAGRDPMSVRIYHNIIVAPDLPQEDRKSVV